MAKKKAKRKSIYIPIDLAKVRASLEPNADGITKLDCGRDEERIRKMYGAKRPRRGKASKRKGGDRK